MVANLQTKPTGYNLASTGDGGSTGSKFLCAFSPKHLHAYFCLIHRRSVDSVATNFIWLRLSSHSFHVPSSMSMLLAFACICSTLPGVRTHAVAAQVVGLRLLSPHAGREETAALHRDAPGGPKYRRDK